MISHLTCVHWRWLMRICKKKKMLAAKAKKMGFFLKKMWIMENGNKKPGNNSAE